MILRKTESLINAMIIGDMKQNGVQYTRVCVRVCCLSLYTFRFQIQYMRSKPSYECPLCEGDYLSEFNTEV